MENLAISSIKSKILQDLSNEGLIRAAIISMTLNLLHRFVHSINQSMPYRSRSYHCNLGRRLLEWVIDCIKWTCLPLWLLYCGYFRWEELRSRRPTHIIFGTSYCQPDCAKSGRKLVFACPSTIVPSQRDSRVRVEQSVVESFTYHYVNVPASDFRLQKYCTRDLVSAELG